MRSRQRLVVGNWKMHGSRAENALLLRAILDGLVEMPQCRAAVCVPYPYLEQTQALLSGSSLVWGAQNISEFEQGAFTGEVSGAMLADFGCRFTLVGHSERRALHGETDAKVAEKAERALAIGIDPIVCVGETLAEREAGQTMAVVGRQLATVMDRIGAGMAKAVLAYEPVWAIGTGRTATPEQAQEVHAHLRTQVAQRSTEMAESLVLLYGGSVKPSNARELFGMPDIDGGLIGGASLVAKDFLGIVAAARNTQAA